MDMGMNTGGMSMSSTGMGMDMDDMDMDMDTMDMAGHGAYFTHNQRGDTIYLWSDWTIDGDGEYAAAVVFTILCAILLEYLQSVQPQLDTLIDTCFPATETKLPGGLTQVQFGPVAQLLRGLLHGLRIAVALIVMLAAMTFDVGLFFSAVAGAIIGWMTFRRTRYVKGTEPARACGCTYSEAPPTFHQPAPASTATTDPSDGKIQELEGIAIACDKADCSCGCATDGTPCTCKEDSAATEGQVDAPVAVPVAAPAASGSCCGGSAGTVAAVSVPAPAPAAASGSCCKA